jgi:hypothetical protein
MAKVKVMVLVPAAFAAVGYADVAGSDVVDVEQADADTLVGSGYAELVKGSTAKAKTDK